MGKRGIYRKRLAGVCTSCEVAQRRPGGRYCAACHAAYQRDYRRRARDKAQKSPATPRGGQGGP